MSFRCLAGFSKQQKLRDGVLVSLGVRERRAIDLPSRPQPLGILGRGRPMSRTGVPLSSFERMASASMSLPKEAIRWRPSLGFAMSLTAYAFCPIIPA